MEEIKFELRKTFEPTQATGLIIGSQDIDMRQLQEFFEFIGIRDVRKPDFTRQGLNDAFK